MRLSQFREKLLVEVTVAQALDDRDQLQPHLYCIAALLRKILTRIGDTLRIPVTVLPLADNFTERTETLGFLSSRILHAGEFAMGPHFCTIVSDHDMTRIRTRRIHTDDFLNAARRVASDDETVLPALTRQARTKANEVVQGGRVAAEVLEARRFAQPGLKAEALEVEALETVADVFELARTSNQANSAPGYLTIWVQPDGEEMLQRLQRGEDVPVRPRHTSYSALVDNLFRTWVPFAMRQWRAHPRLGTTLDFHGEQNEWWCIAADDLLVFLEAAERQWLN